MTQFQKILKQIISQANDTDSEFLNDLESEIIDILDQTDKQTKNNESSNDSSQSESNQSNTDNSQESFLSEISTSQDEVSDSDNDKKEKEQKKQKKTEKNEISENVFNTFIKIMTSSGFQELKNNVFKFRKFQTDDMNEQISAQCKEIINKTNEFSEIRHVQKLIWYYIPQRKYKFRN